MKWIQVERSEVLRGCVKLPGSKNSSLALLAASCLADEPVRLNGVPAIADFKVIADIGRDIGLLIRREAGGQVFVDPRSIHTATIARRKRL